MMSEMMKECCGKNGLPDLEKMKGFMQMHGKTDFTDDEIKMMQQFCSQSGKPDAEKLQQFMKDCGC